jgi:hypothetical protein
MSGIFGATTIKGNRLTEVAGQTATVGIPIPFGYGKFPVDGNVIWAGKLVEHVTKKKQGKGGVKTEEYSYTLSYAIAFCAGPIYGYLTIKRDGKVVYTTDPNATIDDKAYAAKWKQKATFYFGTRTQMPDSTIEADHGAGKVSAFRDLAYIVVEEDDVTANGGAAPQYQAVVVASPPEVYITSRPYAVESSDYLRTDISAQRVKLWPQPFPLDNVLTALELLEITRFGGTEAYTVPSENLSVALDPIQITRFGGAEVYTVPPDDLIMALEPIEITRFGGAVSYTIPPDNLITTIEPLEITRSVP